MGLVIHCWGGGCYTISAVVILGGVYINLRSLCNLLVGGRFDTNNLGGLCNLLVGIGFDTNNLRGLCNLLIVGRGGPTLIVGVHIIYWLDWVLQSWLVMYLLWG